MGLTGPHLEVIWPASATQGLSRGSLGYDGVPAIAGLDRGQKRPPVGVWLQGITPRSGSGYMGVTVP